MVLGECNRVISSYQLVDYVNWPPYCTETLYGSQFALTIQLITLNYPVIYKVDIVHVLTKIREKRVYTHFTACFTIAVKLVVQQLNLVPQVVFPG